jgi:hypothetical protein
LELEGIELHVMKLVQVVSSRSPKLHAMRPDGRVTGCGQHTRKDIIRDGGRAQICGGCRRYWLRYGIDISKALEKEEKDNGTVAEQ